MCQEVALLPFCETRRKPVIRFPNGESNHAIGRAATAELVGAVVVRIVLGPLKLRCIP